MSQQPDYDRQSETGGTSEVAVLPLLDSGGPKIGCRLKAWTACWQARATRVSALSLLLLNTSLLSACLSQEVPEATLELVPHARLTHPPLSEISGITRSISRDDLYWIHNDSGDEARIFAINGDGET